MKTKLCRIVAIAFGAWILSNVASPARAAHWAYEGAHGPEHWEGICASGQQQSPIDISGAQTAPLPALTIQYTRSPLKIIDNGHSLQAIFGSEQNTLTVGGTSYTLLQMHFHHPSEEKLQGTPSDMVAHFVHRSKAGKYAVVAVLLKQGQANPYIETLWANWPKEKAKESAPANFQVNPAELLPAKRGYYTFPGSLTTPPCDEGISWFVLKQPMELSEAQLARFAKTYPNNARPVQPLHGRVVQQTAD
jgi:carbonic anhydrase